ncbi:MAG: Zn-ribbon domain-containing OB-fold protein [Gammaproteobacteria bacterium]|mgnify:FL=1|jgi:uncharacterized OB-fold protein|tara:strand:- start:197 stop:628 length:432 start_codon:yes stop_codon:yes gene_type:complete
MIENIPIPGINDFDKIFWENCTKNIFSIQHCASCDEPRFPPRHMCPRCQSIEHIWKIVSGSGQLWSFVVPRPPLLPYFEKQSPYVVGLIQLDGYKNIRIIGRISNSDNTTQLDIDNLKIGSAVSINFHKINSDISIPFWYLDS